MTATGVPARTPPAKLASPSLLLRSLRLSPRPSLGHWGSVCAASAWRTRGGGRNCARGPIE
eukprot:4380670-Alexandrium_andersonii.AAC.1